MTRLIKKFQYAFNGLMYGLKKDRSIQIQYGFALGALVACFIFHFSYIESAIVMVCCSLVIGFEYINSSIEGILNIFYPNKSGADDVRIIKDMAAGAVLVASLISLIIGVMFILKHIGV